MMCDVVFMNDRSQDRVVIAKNVPLLRARSHRVISGDLVVQTGTTKIVINTVWLWDWEKKDPNSYANRKIRFP